MYRRISGWSVTPVLLVALVVLALGACGGGGEAGSQEEPEVRPLPKESQGLQPGDYRSEKFEPPVSFRVGKGWNFEEEGPDFLAMGRSSMEGGIGFARIENVYKPAPEDDKTSISTLVKAPEDLVGWFQDHPYLEVEGLEPITVGGIEGQQFDIVVDVPKDQFGTCGADCLDGAELTDGSVLAYFEGEKLRAIVLDVKGERVYIDYGAPAANFDEVAPEARKVLDSVEWKGA